MVIKIKPLRLLKKYISKSEGTKIKVLCDWRMQIWVGVWGKAPAKLWELFSNSKHQKALLCKIVNSKLMSNSNLHCLKGQGLLNTFPNLLLPIPPFSGPYPTSSLPSFFFLFLSLITLFSSLPFCSFLFPPFLFHSLLFSSLPYFSLTFPPFLLPFPPFILPSFSPLKDR